MKNYPTIILSRILSVGNLNSIYKTNRIKTSKYSWYDFIFKNILEQYNNLANVYFLIMLILQLIPVVSISGGIPFYLPAIMVILTITGTLDAISDIKRHKSDNEENNEITHIYDFEQNHYKIKKWKDIMVGNIVMIHCNERIPCDIVLLHCKGAQNICYIETKNLDGEINLKTKFPLKISNEQSQSIKSYEQFFKDAEILCDHPDPYLYKFEGQIMLSSYESPINYENFILRGSILKRGEYIIGVSIYTGHETKIMKNTLVTKPKVSQVQSLSSQRVVILFIIQIIVAIFCAIYYAFWTESNINNTFYLNGTDSTNFNNNFWIGFFIWNQLVSLVPISSIINLEAVRIFQQLVIIYDVNFQKNKLKGKPSVYNMKAIENLGQVEHIFSDKTGTLTSNIMKFKAISINGNIFGMNEVNAHTNVTESNKTINEVKNVEFNDNQLSELMLNGDENMKHEIDLMLFGLSICHSVVIDEDKKQSASSPDEIALVNFAKYMGYDFICTDINDQNLIHLNVKGTPTSVKILKNLEFTSERKRGSIIIETKEGKIMIFTKGADDILLSRLDMNINDEKNNKDLLENTKIHLDKFAKKGLRTLVLCYREIKQEEYEQWNLKYTKVNLEIKNREIMKHQLEDEIENNYKLLGATAVEDELQLGVIETIEHFYKVGQKLWILTGDKVETSTTIAKSCGIITDNTEVDFINKDSWEENKKLINDFSLDKINKKEKVLVITGSTLIHLNHEDKFSSKFMKLCCQYKSLIICRTSPKQKGEIIQYYKQEKPNSITLAIGDGANDVTMIINSNIGIGIRGVEGAQAARASDVAIHEFRDLRYLIFIHGREIYRRNSQLLIFIFQRNFILTLSYIILGFISCMSGQTVQYIPMTPYYQLFFTNACISCYAILDKEFQDKILLSEPKTYTIRLNGGLYGPLKFWIAMLIGTLQGCAVFAYSFYSIGLNFVTSRGNLDTFWIEAMMSYWWAVLVTNLKALLMSSRINLTVIISILVGPLIFQLVFFIYSSDSQDILGFLQEITWNMPNYYISGVLVIVICNVMEWGLKTYAKLKYI